MRIVHLILLVSYAFNAYSAGNDGFGVYSADFKEEAGTRIGVPHEIPAISTDTIGLCYAATAGYAYQFAYCAAKKLDCSTLTSEKRPSTLFMSSFGAGGSADAGPDGKGTKRSLNDSVSDGGVAHEALYNAIYNVNSVPRESCAPFDQAVAKMGSREEVEKLQGDSWVNFRNTYELYKKDPQCAECGLSQEMSAGLDRIRQDFSIKKTNTEILKAFSTESFAKALENTLIPAKCLVDPKEQLILDEQDWDFKFGKGAEFKDYPTAIKKIKEILPNPIIVDGYCAMDNKPNDINKCEEKTKDINGQEVSEKKWHSLLITDYASVCKCAAGITKCNKTNGTCRDVVHVLNSWGEEWQKANNDGWVDAKMVLDRTFYKSNAFNWLEDKRKH